MRIQVTGIESALNAFNQLPVRMQFKHMRIALNAGAGVIRDRAKQIVPKDTNLLARSLSIKVKIPNASYNPNHWGKPEYAVIGARRRALSQVIYGATKTGKLTVKTRINLKGLVRGGGKVRSASRYLHLVEKGTPHVMARPFLYTAARTEGPTAQKKMIRKLEQGLQQEAAALSAGP